MARLPYLDEEDLADEDKSIVARGMNLHRILAHSPEAARRYSGLARYMRFESGLDPRLREMAILQVGYLAKSPYDYSHHLRLGREVGVNGGDVKAIETETAGKDSGLPDLDRAVLRAAREMSEGVALNDGTYDVLHNHLSVAHIVDLLMVIAFYHGAVRLLGALEIDVEPAFQAELNAHPFASS
jgi:alkylhydroperoxidase family enzyme